MRLIGDVHGKFRRYKEILENSPPSIQVGDMGVGFRRWPHGEYTANPPNERMVQGDHRFIRGNHDNPAACTGQSQWIPDGNIENGVMFIGGADSIDREFRVEDFSWWPDEQLSREQLAHLHEVYIDAKPRVMITHDCPQGVAREIFRQMRKGQYIEDLETTPTRYALHNMWTSHSPELWVFGHWHRSFDHILRGTRFVCLAELEYRDDLL